MESSAVNEKEDLVPALWQLDVDEFSNHLIKKIHVHKPLIVVFLEETLSVEDFSWQDTKHRGSFPQIRNITMMSARQEFIPAVDDPIASLRELTVSHDYTWKKYDGQKLPTESGIILIVKLKDPLTNEDRPDLLRRHDGNIADIYSQLLAKHSRIVALYTGKQSSWVELESNRVRRQVSPPGVDGNPGVTYRLKDIQIFSNYYPTLFDNGNNITLSPTPYLSDDTRKGYRRLILTFTFSEEPKKILLRFKFPKANGRWSLSEIEYQSDNRSAVLTPSLDISEKINSAYGHIGNVIFKNDTAGVSLVFWDITVQAYAQGDLTKNVFIAANSPPFFTAPIWSGLIVTFVLGIILAWGIIMLMDIRTMDRFDDPKGKTITVTASE